MRLGDFDTIVTSLAEQAAIPIEVALQRSVTEGLQPFDRLKSLLALLTAASIVASIIGSIVVARRITQPLAALSRFASRVRDGDYTARSSSIAKTRSGHCPTASTTCWTASRRAQAEILRLAYEDTVTGLPNRAMFNLRLDASGRALPARRRPSRCC